MAATRHPWGFITRISLLKKSLLCNPSAKRQSCPFLLPLQKAIKGVPNAAHLSSLSLSLSLRHQPSTIAKNKSLNMRSMSSPSSSKGIAAIVGVGPKLGCSIARKFAHEGYTVAILARDLTKLSRLAEEIAREAKAQVFAIRVDCSDSKSVHEAFEGVLSLGFVEILVYNACDPVSSCQPTKFTSLTLESFERSLAVSVVGAFHCAQQVIPGMVERGRGTIIFTGSSASVNGFAGYCELSCGKFALRGLSQCLAREFQLSGVHVAHVIIDGAVGMPRSSRRDPSTQITMDPDAVAQTYWQIHTQDKSAWTQEINLRSSKQMP